MVSRFTTKELTTLTALSTAKGTRSYHEHFWYDQVQDPDPDGNRPGGENTKISILKFSSRFILAIRVPLYFQLLLMALAEAVGIFPLIGERV